MKIPDVSMELWKNLYDAAVRFKAIEPWKTVDDSRLFGIVDPVTGKPGYACILGASGMFFGFCIFRGHEGYHYFLDLQNRATFSEDEVNLGMQDCLMLSYSDRHELDSHDLDRIKMLGYQFRGQNAWPQFREYLPGYYPWHFTEEHARFMLFALNCAIDLVNKIRNAEQIFLENAAGEILTYRRQQNGATSFEAAWVSAPPRAETPLMPPLVPNELTVCRIQTMNLKQGGVWEAHHFYMPGKIMDRDRPYFAPMAMVADRASGYIFHGNVVVPEENVVYALGNAILDAIQKHRIKPIEIRVRDAQTASGLVTLCYELGIGLIEDRNLPAIFEARRALAHAASGHFR